MDRVLLFVRDGFDIVRCSGCGLVFVGNPPRPKDMHRYYGQDYYEGGNEQVFQNYLGEREQRIASFRAKVRRIRRIIRTGRLLDVGCAAGFFLEAAKDSYDVSGVELSEFSARHASECLGHRVFIGDLLSAGFANDTFDVVTMWDVIEHVSDPLACLEEAHRILRPGGLLVLSTGDVSSLNSRVHGATWGLMAPPWHLYYFSRRLLIGTLQRLGFSLHKITTNGNLIGTANRFVYNPVTAGIVSLLKLGDTMTIYVQKRERISR